MQTVTLKSFDNYFSANILLTRLQADGIPCFLKDEHTVTIDPILSNAIGGIKLEVPAEKAQMALLLLKEYEEDYLEAAECPKCHAHDIQLVSKKNAGNFIYLIRSASFLSSFSSTKVPKGMIEAIKAFTNHPNFLLRAFMVSQASTMKATNRIPCSMPTTFTATGRFAKYFKGIAIPKSTRKDIPSVIAIILNQ